MIGVLVHRWASVLCRASRAVSLRPSLDLVSSRLGPYRLDAKEDEAVRMIMGDG